MHFTPAIVAMSTPSLVLRYAAAFFFVVVAVLSPTHSSRLPRLCNESTRCSPTSTRGYSAHAEGGTTLTASTPISAMSTRSQRCRNITDKLDSMANAVESA